MKVEDIGIVILIVCVSLKICMGVEIYRNYTFGEDCGVNTDEVQQYKPMVVFYRGKDVIGSSCKEMIFKCDEPCNVCMSVKDFSDPDCAIKLEFKESSTAVTERTITCTKNEKDEFCRSSSLSVILTITSSISSSNAKFDLIISKEELDEREREIDTKWRILIIVSVAAGVGIPVLCVIGCVVFKFCVIHANRNSRGTMYNPGNSGGMAYQNNTSFPNSGYSQYPQENDHTKQRDGATSRF